MNLLINSMSTKLWDNNVNYLINTYCEVGPSLSTL